MTEHLLAKGSYANVYIEKFGKYTHKDYVVNSTDMNEVQNALLDMIYILDKFNIENKSSIKVPRIYSYKLIQNSEQCTLSTIEDFCGYSIRDLIRKNRISDLQLESVIKEISKLPENIPIDVHPGNFCCYQNDIYLVDFFPAFPYHEIYSFENHKNIPMEQQLRKLNRYYYNSKRIEKFLYYVKLSRSL